MILYCFKVAQTCGSFLPGIFTSRIRAVISAARKTMIMIAKLIYINNLSGVAFSKRAHDISLLLW